MILPLTLNKIYYVYEHRTKDTNELFYVGKGCGLRAFSPNQRNRWWKSKVAKHSGFVSNVVDYFPNAQMALDLEVQLISSYRQSGHKLCNLSEGGESCSGYVYTDEQRRARSVATKRSWERDPQRKIRLAERVRNSEVMKEVARKMGLKNKGRKRIRLDGTN